MKYRFSEVAKLLDLSSEAIRYYESKGIIQPERDETGYRIYKMVQTMNEFLQSMHL